jgi:ATP-binding cassette, subfamily B, bacterial
LSERDRTARDGATAGARRRADFGPLRTLLGFLSAYRWAIAAGALALVVSAGAMLAFGKGLGWLVDRGFGEGGQRLDEALLWLFAIVGVLAVATFFRAYAVNWIGDRLAADLRRAVFANVVRQDPAFFETTPTGEVLSRLTADTTLLQTVLGSSASMALRNVLMLVGGVALMALTSWKLTAIAFVVVPVVVLPILVFGRRVRRLSRASQDRIGDVGAQVDETLNAVRIVQAFAQEPAETRRFERQVENAFAAATVRNRARALLAGWAILTSFAAVGLILWIGARDLVAGRMTAGDLSAFLFYAVLAASAVGALAEFAADLQRAAGAAERLVELLNAKPAISAPASPAILPEPARGAVAFERVTFSYPARPERKALDAFSLHIRPGETVALVGPSGAGKTTVFQLLLRFYDPQAGRVTLDGVDIAAVDPAELRGRLALVPQDPIIFTGTVAENIAFGRPGADEAAIRRAAEAAAALGFIAGLPQGFATPLGEKGVRLSGGQRQRIAIARAILRQPAVLLLDEATSALDAESERKVQGALERAKAGRTTLVIAHRLATVLGADRIAVMDEGRVVAEGRHAELVRDNGLYARLAALQFDAARAAE